jgi:hypothetical protein
MDFVPVTPWSTPTSQTQILNLSVEFQPVNSLDVLPQPMNPAAILSVQMDLEEETSPAHLQANGQLPRAHQFLDTAQILGGTLFLRDLFHTGRRSTISLLVEKVYLASICQHVLHCLLLRLVL